MSKLSDGEVSLVSLWQNERFISHINSIVIKAYHQANSHTSLVCFTFTWYVDLGLGSLSVAYIGPKSRTERPRKTKIGKVVAHVTRDSDTTVKVKVTRPLYSARPWRVRRLQNVFGVGKYCYVASARRRTRRLGTGGGEGGGILCRHAHSSFVCRITQELQWLTHLRYKPAHSHTS